MALAQYVNAVQVYDQVAAVYPVVVKEHLRTFSRLVISQYAHSIQPCYAAGYLLQGYAQLPCYCSFSYSRRKVEDGIIHAQQAHCHIIQVRMGLFQGVKYMAVYGKL